LAEVTTLAAKYDPYNVSDPEKNDIYITKNTTPLHDQIMGQRISLIPVYADSKMILKHKRQDLTFAIDVKNEGNEPVDVTTKDIVILDSEGSPLPEAKRLKLLPPDSHTGDFPIVARLKPRGDIFQCNFRIRQGIAREHAGFACVSTCTYEFEPDLKGEYIKNSFLFTIESECGLTAAEIVLAAFDALADRVASLHERTKILNDDEVEFQDEDHTIGNLYQAFCDRTFEKLAGVGYYMPHPHVRVIRVKLSFEKNKKEDLQAFVDESSSALLLWIEEMREQFGAFVG
jgi:DNA-directed RNA polymerase subunit L